MTTENYLYILYHQRGQRAPEIHYTTTNYDDMIIELYRVRKLGDSFLNVFRIELNKSYRVTSFRGGSGYKGTHRTECGERSSNTDHLLENGMITNSLAPFYLKWYRYSIPETEMKKVLQLKEFYGL
jgi:hypothetical protein